MCRTFDGELMAFPLFGPWGFSYGKIGTLKSRVQMLRQQQ